MHRLQATMINVKNPQIAQAIVLNWCCSSVTPTAENPMQPTAKMIKFMQLNQIFKCNFISMIKIFYSLKREEQIVTTRVLRTVGIEYRGE